jgi:hypothetical protein
MPKLVLFSGQSTRLHSAKRDCNLMLPFQPIHGNFQVELLQLCDAHISRELSYIHNVPPCRITVIAQCQDFPRRAMKDPLDRVWAVQLLARPAERPKVLNRKWESNAKHRQPYCLLRYQQKR